MRNKLIFRLVNPTIKSWGKYISLEENLIVLCQTFGVQVYNHSNNETDITKIIFV